MPETRIPWRTDNAVSWDTLRFGKPTDVRSFPGLASIKAKTVLQVEAPKAKGKRGANIRAQGLELVELTIRLRIWTKQQHETLQPLLPLLFPRDSAGKKGKDDPPGPMGIDHPVPRLHKVSQCVVTSFEGPDSEGGGFDEYTVVAKQFHPPATTGLLGGTVRANKAQQEATLKGLLEKQAQIRALMVPLYMKGAFKTYLEDVQFGQYKVIDDDLSGQIRIAQNELYGGAIPPSSPEKPTNTRAGSLSNNDASGSV